MAKLMYVLGILLAAIGVALGVLNYASPGQMQVLGLLPDVAAILLVGGILAIGLGGVIAALGRGGAMAMEAVAPTETYFEPEPVAASSAVEAQAPAQPRFSGFGKKAVGAAAGVVVAAEATKAATAPVVSDSVADTIAALEKAKTDINNALGGTENFAPPPVPVETPTVVENLDTDPEVVAEDAAPTVDADAPEGGELFVIEEKIIRGRPARVLSDGTVEAETDEGWMRFENLEHLDEYLDATSAEEV
jgi:hypothetical protein